MSQSAKRRLAILLPILLTAMMACSPGDCFCSHERPSAQKTNG